MFDELESPARKEGIIKAFNTGVRYVEALQLGEADGHPVKCLGLLNLRICIAVALFLSKVLHSTYRQYVDVDAGTNAFNSTISAYKQSSVEDNDTNGRSTKFLAQIWAIHADMFETCPQPPSISIKSRLFFSIVHDCLWQWREKYAGKPSNGAPSLPPPLISPGSSSSYVDPILTGNTQAALNLPLSLFGTPESVLPATNGSDNSMGLSAFVDPQFTGSEHFPPSDAAIWPSSAVPPHDGLSRNNAQDTPNAMGYDMVFPDGVVSCSELTWYRLTRQ